MHSAGQCPWITSFSCSRWQTFKVGVLFSLSCFPSWCSLSSLSRRRCGLCCKRDNHEWWGTDSADDDGQGKDDRSTVLSFQGLGKAHFPVSVHQVRPLCDALSCTISSNPPELLQVHSHYPKPLGSCKFLNSEISDFRQAIWCIYHIFNLYHPQWDLRQHPINNHFIHIKNMNWLATVQSEIDANYFVPNVWKVIWSILYWNRKWQNTTTSVLTRRLNVIHSLELKITLNPDTSYVFDTIITLCKWDGVLA